MNKPRTLYSTFFISPKASHALRALYFVVFAFIIVSCNKPKKEVISEIDAMNKVLSTENAENVEITHTDSGYLKVVLKAPKVLAVKDQENPYVEMKEGLTADFYNRQKIKESNISSEYGINYQAKKLIVLKKNVKVVNTKGEKLFTEELFWDQTKEKIYTDKFVKIVTPDQTLTGYGMESNQDFTNWQIKKASGELNLNK